MDKKILQKILDEIQVFDMVSRRTNQDFEDVPYVQSLDEPYITHKALYEQEEPEEEEEAPPEKEQPVEEAPPQESEEQAPEGMPPEEGGMDQNFGAVEEPPKDPNEIGRIYELKKIYSRLLSIESYLSDSSDVNLLKLRQYVSQAIEMFEIISANMPSYKDQLDDMIIMYYKFLSVVYTLLKKYYAAQEKEDSKRKKK